MDRKHWTLMIVPENGTGVRQVHLSSAKLRWWVGGGLATVLILLVLAAGFFVLESRHLQANRLARANALLQNEMDGMRGRMAELTKTLDRLSQKDEEYRLLAGLSGWDEDIRKAGIGGPGTETLQSTALWRADAELGEAAFKTNEDLNTLLRRAHVLETSWDEATTALQKQNKRWAATPSIMPVVHGYISSPFSKARYHPILHITRPHKGIDIVAPRGTPVFAAADGRVTFVGQNGDFGYMVEIDHGYGMRTRYAHISKNIPVKRGDRVKRGQKVAEVGMSGLVTNPSLHYEVLVNGRARDPKDYILGDVLPF
ncbi:MAG: M23 family metallopeptidase [Gemmatimonadota bacterium]